MYPNTICGWTFDRNVPNPKLANGLYLMEMFSKTDLRTDQKCQSAIGLSTHCETVCSLVLRNAPVHIDIDVDVEELLQSKRGQATYTQIKQYVMEHTGLNVPNLYISQIKRKYGLDVGESYNKPKSDNPRVPQCPPEKEAAIEEAMKFFGIIDIPSSNSH